MTYLSAPHFAPLIQEVGAQLLPFFEAEREEGMLTGQHLWARLVPEGRPGQLTELVSAKLRAVLETDAYDLLLIDRHYVTSYRCRLNTMPARRVLFFATSFLRWQGREQEMLAGSPTLVFCPAELEVPRYRERGQEVHYVEPSIYTGPEIAAIKESQMEGSVPLILVLLGTQSVRYPGLKQTWAMLAEVARQMPDHRFIVATGKGLAHLGIATNTANFSVHEQLPQRQLLRQANIVITHGGLGTLKEAILCEVPALVLPFLADQPLNAARVTTCGIGSALFPEEQTRETILFELQRLLSGEFSKALSRLAAIFRQQEMLRPSRQIIDQILNA